MWGLCVFVYVHHVIGRLAWSEVLTSLFHHYIRLPEEGATENMWRWEWHTHIPTNTHTHTWRNLAGYKIHVLISEILSLTSQRSHLLIYAEFTATCSTACVTLILLHNHFLNLTSVSWSNHSRHCCWSLKHTLSRALTPQVSYSSLQNLLTQLFPVSLVSSSLFIPAHWWMIFSACYRPAMFKQGTALWVLFHSLREEKPPFSTLWVVMSHGKGACLWQATSCCITLLMSHS